MTVPGVSPHPHLASDQIIADEHLLIVECRQLALEAVGPACDPQYHDDLVNLITETMEKSFHHLELTGHSYSRRLMRRAALIDFTSLFRRTREAMEKTAPYEWIDDFYHLIDGWESKAYDRRWLVLHMQAWEREAEALTDPSSFRPA